MPVDTFFEMVGHKGTYLINEKLPDPFGRAGIHIQEAIEVCLRWDLRVTPVELWPTAINYKGATPRTVQFKQEDNWTRFQRHLYASRGVIAGRTHKAGHAVAYDRGLIYDPRGQEYTYTAKACEDRGFFTTCLWRIDQ